MQVKDALFAREESRRNIAESCLSFHEVLKVNDLRVRSPYGTVLAFHPDTQLTNYNIMKIKRILLPVSLAAFICAVGVACDETVVQEQTTTRTTSNPGSYYAPPSVNTSRSTTTTVMDEDDYEDRFDD